MKRRQQTVFTPGQNLILKAFINMALSCCSRSSYKSAVVTRKPAMLPETVDDFWSQVADLASSCCVRSGIIFVSGYFRYNCC